MFLVVINDKNDIIKETQTQAGTLTQAFEEESFDSEVYRSIPYIDFNVKIFVHFLIFFSDCYDAGFCQETQDGKGSYNFGTTNFPHSSI